MSVGATPAKLTMSGCNIARDIGQIIRDLLWSVWPSDIDDAQTMREPCNRNFGACYFLHRLMASGHIGLFLRWYAVDLITRKLRRIFFIGHVDDPQKCG